MAQKTGGIAFKTTLLGKAGGGPTGIHVPDAVVAKLGGGKRAPVNVTIDGFSYRSTIAMMGGRAMLPVSAERRAAAKVEVGDAVAVTLRLDTAERTVDVPPALVKALAKDKAAKAAFEALSYTFRKEHARAITEAKSDETRARRLAKIMAGLKKK